MTTGARGISRLPAFDLRPIPAISPIGDKGYLTQTQLEAGPATTPLRAALPLFATGLGALGLLGCRRKRKQIA